MYTIVSKNERFSRVKYHWNASMFTLDIVLSNGPVKYSINIQSIKSYIFNLLEYHYSYIPITYAIVFLKTNFKMYIILNWLG